MNVMNAEFRERLIGRINRENYFQIKVRISPLFWKECLAEIIQRNLGGSSESIKRARELSNFSLRIQKLRDRPEGKWKKILEELRFNELNIIYELRE